LEKFISLAEKYDLFIMADEVYGRLTHQNNFTPIYTLSQKVPMIVMKGLSKEIP
jgi:aspartate/methionine/tyrosine aminotransferase